MDAIEKPFERAVRIAGGQRALARLCNTSQTRIWQCIHRNKRVPAELVLLVEAAVGGAVTRHEMRPDLYPID
jgi:DNA-binding transcriptional regulator YdaS (Cro superfamily)